MEQKHTGEAQLKAIQVLLDIHIGGTVGYGSIKFYENGVIFCVQLNFQKNKRKNPKERVPLIFLHWP